MLICSPISCIQDKNLGDIIKLAIGRVRELHPDALGPIMVEAIKESHAAQGRNTYAVKELATKLALTFGVDMTKYRKPIVQIVLYARGSFATILIRVCRDGFEFATAHLDQGMGGLRILEAFKEFSRKLVTQVCRIS